MSKPESYDEPPTTHSTEGSGCEDTSGGRITGTLQGVQALLGVQTCFMSVQDITVNSKGMCNRVQEGHGIEYQNYSNNPAYLNWMSQAGLW